MRSRLGVALTLLAVGWTAAPAQAQWVVTPYVGGNIAGDVEFRRGGPGGSVGYLGSRLGFELDFLRYQHFFRDRDIAEIIPDNCGVNSLHAFCTDANTDAIGFTGNVVAPFRIKGATKWLPYATAGFGVIHAWVEDPSRSLVDTDQTNLGVNIGGGMMYSLSHHLGLRGDLRYSRVFVDENEREGGLYRDYGFLRMSLGVTLAFGH